jgi:hypothetical protein
MKLVIKECDFDSDSLYDKYKKLGMNLIWTKRNFEEIKICDMTDEHIKNVIRMLNKKSIFNSIYDTTNEWLDIFADVLIKRRTIKLNKLKKNINERRLFI